MKDAYYFIVKAFLVLKIFKFLSCLFEQVEKMARLERQINFKMYDVTTWLSNIYNANIAQYVRK